MERERPRAGIGRLPTPVEAATELGDELGVPNLYVKDESVAGTLYGGNKIRKLDLVLGDALERGCSRVITGGGIGSNHVLATATYAREVGLRPAAVQFPQPVTGYVRRNLRSLAGFDPDLHLTRSELVFPAAILKTRIDARFDDETYYVPLGGSSPLGTLGYVEAVGELQRQIEGGDLPQPDVMVVPTSSAGTHAGLQVGVDHYGLDVRVVGVQVAPSIVTNRWTVARLANKTAALLGPEANLDYSRHDVHLETGYLGDGYAEPTQSGRRVKEIAASYDLTLDLTYTAKTVAAIAGEFTDETVLYWYTLGDVRPDVLSPEEAIDRLPAAYRKYIAEEQS